MLQDLFLTLVTVFVVDPAQAELSARLAALNAPAAVVQTVSGCVSAAPAALASLYGDDPVRGVATVVRLWTGLTTYQAVLQAEVPACHLALEAARPFISPEAG